MLLLPWEKSDILHFIYHHTPGRGNTRAEFSKRSLAVSFSVLPLVSLPILSSSEHQKYPTKFHGTPSSMMPPFLLIKMVDLPVLPFCCLFSLFFKSCMFHIKDLKAGLSKSSPHPVLDVSLPHHIWFTWRNHHQTAVLKSLLTIQSTESSVFGAGKHLMLHLDCRQMWHMQPVSNLLKTVWTVQIQFFFQIRPRPLSYVVLKR